MYIIIELVTLRFAFMENSIGAARRTNFTDAQTALSSAKRPLEKKDAKAEEKNHVYTDKTGRGELAASPSTAIDTTPVHYNSHNVNQVPADAAKELRESMPNPHQTGAKTEAQSEIPIKLGCFDRLKAFFGFSLIRKFVVAHTLKQLDSSKTISSEHFNELKTYYGSKETIHLLGANRNKLKAMFDAAAGTDIEKFTRTYSELELPGTTFLKMRSEISREVAKRTNAEVFFKKNSIEFKSEHFQNPSKLDAADRFIKAYNECMKEVVFSGGLSSVSSIKLDEAMQEMQRALGESEASQLCSELKKFNHSYNGIADQQTVTSKSQLSKMQKESIVENFGYLKQACLKNNSEEINKFYSEFIKKTDGINDQHVERLRKHAATLAGKEPPVKAPSADTKQSDFNNATSVNDHTAKRPYEEAAILVSKEAEVSASIIDTKETVAKPIEKPAVNTIQFLHRPQMIPVEKIAQKKLKGEASSEVKKKTVTERLQHNINSAEKDHANEADKDFSLIKELEKAKKTDTAKLEAVGPYEVGISEQKGEYRKTMEDASIARELQLSIGDEQLRVPLFGVFDGHGGADASKFVKDNIGRVLTNKLMKYNQKGFNDTGIFLALKECCKELDEEYAKEPNKDGTTATFSVVIDGYIWTANVGDSRTTLVEIEENGISRAKPLSQDAKPDNPRFQKRVEKAGGEIFKTRDGVRVAGEWAVAGAIGDHSAVDENGDKFMPSNPKITKQPVPKGKPNFLVFACDGLFDVTSNNQLGRAVAELAQQDNMDACKMAQYLTQSAINSGSLDNVSVVVVKL